MTEKPTETNDKAYKLVPTHDSGDDHLSVAESWRSTKNRRIVSCLNYCWKLTFGNIGETWLFLTFLGVLMGIISFVVDFGIASCMRARSYMFRELITHPFLQYLGWIALPLCLIWFSTSFTYLVAPAAAGSGIPELKTILRGVVLKESLSYKAWITKIIGLTATLGTGLPLGKEGPFVHIASMTASLLTKAVTAFKGMHDKTRHSDMLSAACAVGVAAAFAAPIGGVLFSIEVTTAFFAVRNYWRGFYAAVCSAIMFRLLAVWFHNEATLTALFKTEYKVARAFAPMELFVFVFLGIVCGVCGAFLVWTDRRYKTFLKTNRFFKLMAKKSFLIYPAFVIIIYTTLTFPLGIGMFSAGELTTHSQVSEMFSNFSWTKENPTIHEFTIIEHWRTPWTGIFMTLISFVIINFIGTILGITLPVPAGVFISSLKLGAAIGRLVGEILFVMFGTVDPYIMPGGYSIAGAAALCGSVTHTVSSSVILVELTGQISHSIPVMICTLISYVVAQLLQPSIFDSVILMRKLPYLPDIISSSSNAYKIFVEDFMIRDVKYIWHGITYNELEQVIMTDRKIKTYPIVDSSDSMVLLGSVSQDELLELLHTHVGQDRKAKYFRDWTVKAEKSLKEEMKINGTNYLINSEQEDSDNNSLAEEKTSRNNFSFRFPSFRNRSFNSSHSRKATSNIDLPSAENRQLGPPPVPKSLPPIDTSPTKPKESTPPPEPKEVVLKETSSPNLSIVSDNNSSASSSLHSIPANLHDRRPSRFSVTKVTSSALMAKMNQQKEESSETKDVSDSRSCQSENVVHSRSSPPPKSILKKTKSFVFEPTTSVRVKPSMRPIYATIHGGDSSRFRNMVASMMGGSRSSQHTFTGVSTSGVPVKQLLKKITEEEAKWVEKEMEKVVCFDACHVDPAPHQLVERTNLLRTHTIFSMMGLSHAYVTAIGRLIGIVSLRALRNAIEHANAGGLTSVQEKKQ